MTDSERAARESRAPGVSGEHLPGEDDRARLERLAAIFEHSTDAIVGKTLDGTITDWNPAAERIYGWTAAEAVGRSIEMVFPPDRLSECAEILERLRRGEETGPHETMRQRKDGSTFPVLVTVSPIRDRTGKVIAGSKAALDLSDLQRRQVAEEALRLRDAFLASAAHDLQQTLATIRGQAQLQLRLLARAGAGGAGLDPARLEKVLRAIDAAARHMGAQIAGMLDEARLESGRPLALSREPTDVVALARELVGEYAQSTERHEVLLESQAPALVGLLDELRVRRLLGNVLSNAVKYSPAGGAITVSVGREEAEGRAVAVVAVRDEGIGIPAADLAHVLEQGFRAGNVRGGEVHGSGLGLASARLVAEQHGGSLAVTSREGEGTTVTLRLPL